MTAIVVRGDARCIPLPDESVDLIVTSPPFFALRSYQDGGEHYDGQIGDEDDLRAYVAALLTCTAEWIRVLKPAGSLWVNLGDKYAERAGPGRPGADQDDPRFRKATRPQRRQVNGIRPKSLIGSPWRYALGCVDELGLILRAEVIWSKPNALPETVFDRIRRSHEQWFHFTKQPRYFSAVDELREPYATDTARRYVLGYGERALDAQRLTVNVKIGGDTYEQNPLGKVPGSVWDVPTESLSVPAVSPLDGKPLPQHFASFPLEWPRRLITGWSPAGICVECGEGRRPACGCNEPIGTPTGTATGCDPSRETGRAGLNRPRGAGAGRRVITRWEQRHYARQLAALPTEQRVVLKMVTGATAWEHYVRTDRSGARPLPPDLLGSLLKDGILTPPPLFTPPPTRPAVVLDPFGGTGATALIASALGRIGVSLDLSHDYSRLARWRTTDPGERARALQVEKPKPQAQGQEVLW